MSRVTATESLDAVRSEGGLLPPDVLQRIAQNDKELPGLEPDDYHLGKTETLAEAITRSWNRLIGLWATFREELAKRPDGDPAQGLTRDRFLLPLFQELGYGRLPRADAGSFVIDDRAFPITHIYHRSPIHLIGAGVDLDRRTAGVAGAATASPHGLVQDYLNRSDDHLWAFLANGRTLRVLRDHYSLTRQAYVEFDLESIFEGELFHAFRLLWLVCHQSRVENEKPEHCWLEKWFETAREEGVRALDHLREGVEAAIAAFGRGFLAHRDNGSLRDALADGELSAQDYYRELLRLVYRLIFLFVAEDRDVLLDPDAPPEAHRRYVAFYATRRIRELARRRRGSAHSDLWEALKLVMGKLGEGYAPLGLPALGSFLWSDECLPNLDRCALTNEALLEALRHLSTFRDGKILYPVNWRNVGSEELGSVYESLLELSPELSKDAATFDLRTKAGHERKTTGSYYTPSSLVDCLLDSALDPVLDDALGSDDPEAALLDLKVCDPACGSGHFLVAAARRIAHRLARLRVEDEEPSPPAMRHALRDVVGRCVFGVDINPMAVELCKVSLWMEAVEPGKPLSFLDSHIQCGNALFGAEPALMAEGPPDVAWTALKGEDKKRAASLRNTNKDWRQTRLFDAVDAPSRGVELHRLASQIESSGDGSIDAVRKKEALWHRLRTGDAGRHAMLVSDLWCASFVWPKHDREAEVAAPVRAAWEAVKKDPATLRSDTAERLVEIKRRFQFFHWHLAFPMVMERGGFDLVLGNPPWDTLSPDRREYFGQHHPGIRSLSPREQKAVISELMTDVAIATGWERHKLDLFGLVHFLKKSGRYTLYAPGNLGKGDFNVYRMFAELALKYTRPGGYAAQVLPGGLYGGANASAIRQFMLDRCELAHLWGLSNTRRGWFGKVDIDRFSAYAAMRGGRTSIFLAHFGLMSPADLAGDPIEFDADFIRTSNPDTYTIPDIRSATDLKVAQKMLEACPAFGDETAGPPLRHYQAELHMGNDRDRFTTELVGLPVYEGRMVAHFDHRAKTYAGGHGNSSRWIERTHEDAEKAIVPQWRVLPEKVPDKLGTRCEQYRLAFCDVANPRNERSFTAALVPPGVICGHKVPTIVFEPFPDYEWSYLPWLAVANSFVMDWLTRSKLSSPSLTYTLLDSLPFPRPAIDDRWVQETAPLVLRLICTAPEMTAFWNRMAALGLCEPAENETVPATALLVETERELARAHLDALVAHDVYGLTRKELGDVLETFPVVKKRDIKAHGDYRTKLLILNAFDRMAARGPEVAELNPPPGDPTQSHSPRAAREE
ncbi:MAG: N-6 DNA methylase [Myxococcota bacterium]|nr:N-6 DNA methylase [Myxococcota bacterium]